MWKPLGILRGHDGSPEYMVTVLAPYGLFRRFEPRHLDRLVPSIRLKDFVDEEIVCHCPDANHNAFLLLEGIAAATKKRGDVIHIVQLQGKGTMFNEGPLAGLEHDLTGARALGRAKVLALDAGMLLRLFHDEPALGYPFALDLCRMSMEQADQQLKHYLPP